MVANGQKKYKTGEGAQFLTRKAALKKLQLSLNDFRKLCIIKGIYPREPRKWKRALKGKSGIRTLYHIKDIQFLMHEAIIWKLRDTKIFNRKMSKAKALKNYSDMKRYLDNRPVVKLDHIVKERYPTFIDALRDLDDCLTLCFLFSSFPSMPHIPRDQTDLCKRLTVEFLNAVIAGKWLKKVFVSIKGYYYQAEIKGQTITWIVPHNFSFEPQSKAEVDFRIMSTFVEFYVYMLGFVNYRLYHTLNMYYPPKSNAIGNVEKPRNDDEDYITETSLFEGKKFFLNREVPREPLVFVIRAFGGEVSWDKTSFAGSTFDENNETITHQIVDRPSMEKQFISRYYVQPQWVFDSINRGELLPVEEYLMGAILPPHLSPFKNEQLNDVYMPPEERAMVDPTYKLDADVDDDDDDEEEEENIEQDEEDAELENTEGPESDQDDNDEEQELDVEEQNKLAKKKTMKVKAGEVVKEVPWAAAKEDKHAFNLRAKLMKPKHKKFYKAVTEGRKDRKKEIHILRKKRMRSDAEKKSQLKKDKKMKTQ
ncbi:hypothetical protein HCN44_006928 [Aphidius gifuensis]|uniref:Pescadillo homolog n=1 Tax=Aphidius gifuensis TaxID=684658 RepID=A0A834Y3H5_APHGI|nr:pescadillo homolog [Aphidius gifuensis]KAF7995821.1 hypothetical protein HCN44_006928 [Aphidius gifuensis]